MFATVVGVALSVVASVWQSGHRTRKALAAHETRCAGDKAAVTKTLKRLDRKLEALGAGLARFRAAMPGRFRRRLERLP